MSEIWIPDRDRSEVVLYRVSYLEDTIADFWGKPIRARVIHDRTIATLTDQIHPYTTNYGVYHAGVYVDDFCRRFWEHAGFAGLPSWNEIDPPKNVPLAEWRDTSHLLTGDRYVRNGEPVLVETLIAEADSLLAQYV